MNFGWVKTKVTPTQLNLFILTIIVGIFLNMFYYIFLFVYWLASSSTKNNSQPFRSKYFSQLSSIYTRETIRFDQPILFLNDSTILPLIYRRCSQINSERFESNQWFENVNLFIVPSNLHIHAEQADPFVKRITDREYCYSISKIQEFKKAYFGKSCYYLYNIAYITVKSNDKNSLQWWDLYKELKESCES